MQGSYVYFLQVDDHPLKPVKIGYTGRHPTARLKEVQQEMPFHRVRLLGHKAGSRDDEASLHHLFSDTMIVAEGMRESEWFYPDGFLNRYIAEYIAGQEV